MAAAGLSSPALSGLCESRKCPRRSIIDKTPEHQDLMIAVREHDANASGYRAGPVKAGVPHVEQMLAVRIHLDDCGSDNGPLRVIAGSHRRGRFNDEELLQHSQGLAVVCTAARGDVLLFRPLLMHASSAASAPAHRRVIHFEYAACDPPGGLEWHDRISPNSPRDQHPCFPSSPSDTMASAGSASNCGSVPSIHPDCDSIQRTRNAPSPSATTAATS